MHKEFVLLAYILWMESEYNFLFCHQEILELALEMYMVPLVCIFFIEHMRLLKGTCLI